MPRLAFPVTMAVLIGFFVASYLRDNVPPMTSRLALVLNPSPVTPAPMPDLTPIAVALAVGTASSASPGPAPVFAVAVLLTIPDRVPTSRGSG